MITGRGTHVGPAADRARDSSRQEPRIPGNSGSRSVAPVTIPAPAAAPAPAKVELTITLTLTLTLILTLTRTRTLTLPLTLTKASANQRAGRAGRVAPGKCFRL